MNKLTTTNNRPYSITPTTFAEAKEYAATLSKTQLVPKQYYNRPDDTLVAIQIGSELGLKPLQALQNIAVINGKPSIYGDALMALVLSHPDCEDIVEEFDNETMTAKCTVVRKGHKAYTVKFSKQDAMDAGLWGKIGPWKTYAKRMLQMRARGFAVRDKFADAIGGLITAEEAQDHPGDNKREIKDLNSKLDNVMNTLDGNDEQQTYEIEKLEQDFNKEAEEPIYELYSLIMEHKVSQDEIDKWLVHANVSKLDELNDEQVQKCINFLKNKYQV